MRAAGSKYTATSRTILRGGEPRTAMPVMRTRTGGFGIWQARHQAARPPVPGSRRGPMGSEHHRGPRAGRGQGIEVKDRGRVLADLMVRFKAAIG